MIISLDLTETAFSALRSMILNKIDYIDYAIPADEQLVLDELAVKFAIVKQEVLDKLDEDQQK